MATRGANIQTTKSTKWVRGIKVTAYHSCSILGDANCCDKSGRGGTMRQCTIVYSASQLSEEDCLTDGPGYGDKFVVVYFLFPFLFLYTNC